MKIVHVAIRFPPAKGGGEQYVYSLAKLQVKMGHEIYVITTDLMKEVPREVDRSLLKKELMDGINVIRMMSFPTFLPVWGYGSAFFGLKKVLDEIKPDIVHTHSYGYFHSDMLARFRKKSKWKLVLTSHGFPPGRGIFRVVKDLYTKFLGTKNVNILDAAIALSEKDKKIFESLGARNSYVIPNGIDLNMFENLPSRDIFRDKYGIKGRMILNVGRLEKIKGQKILIEAFPNIIKDFSDTMLVIVGEDWGELKYLKEIVEDLNLKDNVIFTGSVPYEKMPEVYSAADVFVLPSFHEGLPGTLLEAMACGLPIVTTDVGGMPEVLGNAGSIVKPEEVHLLAQAIKTPFLNSKIKEQKTKLAKEKIKNYSWENISKRILQLYEELL